MRAWPCEGWGRYAVPCARTTRDPSRTCHDHRYQAGCGVPICGVDDRGEWRVYTYPTPTRWAVMQLRLVRGSWFVRKRRRYVAELATALEVRDLWAHQLRTTDERAAAA